MEKFTHLHVHSEYSFDGLAKIQHLLQKASHDGMKYLALTDHHSVMGWFELAALADDYGIKPVFGIELNIDSNHLTALAMNETGLRNLITLNNIGYRNGSKPKITEEQLFTFSKGIFILSGCTKGKIPETLTEKRILKASSLIDDYLRAFDGNLAIETQNYGTGEVYHRINPQLELLADRKGLRLVPTNDVHYLSYFEHSFYQKWVSIQTNGKLKTRNSQNFFKSTKEMRKCFKDDALQNATGIAQECNADFLSYIKNQKGTKEIPTAMVYYYDDAESLKKILTGKKEFKLSSFMYKKMTKEGLKLEDLPLNGNLARDVQHAKVLRGKIMKIEPDPYYYISVNDYFPMMRKNKKSEYFAMIDCITAEKLGFSVHDRRRMAVRH